MRELTWGEWTAFSPGGAFCCPPPLSCRARSDATGLRDTVRRFDSVHHGLRRRLRSIGGYGIKAFGGGLETGRAAVAAT
jgi:hypothetical protein